jgi:molybdopterin converting factor small subunit
MQVTLNYFAQMRAAAGAETETAELPAGTDLAAAVRDAARRHGNEFRALALDADGRLRPSLLVLVNGVPAARDAARPLADGDAVTLMSAVAGG